MTGERIEHWWKDNWQGKTEVLGDEFAPVSFNPLKISHGLPRELKPDLRSERPATKNPRNGTAQF
jgi:hypothetical protein